MLIEHHTFDEEKYINLFKELKISPKVIETETENEKCLAVVEALMFKGQNRTIEETALLRVLVLLIEEFEENIIHSQSGKIQHHMNFCSI